MPQVWRGSLIDLKISCVVGLRPLNPGTLHTSSLLPSPVQQTHPSLKPGQGTRTVSPEKATGSPETAPLPDHSQEISAAQSQSSCSALPTPQPSPEARSGREGPWLVHFLLHCLPDNGQSSTESDQGLTTPQTQIRAKGEGGRLWGRKWSAGPDDQRNPLQTREGGGEGKQSKDVLGPDSPHCSALDTGPNTQTERGLKLRHTCQRVPAPCPALPHSGREVKPSLRTGYSHVISGGDRHLAGQSYHTMPGRTLEEGGLYKVQDHTCLGKGELPRTNIRARSARLPTPSCSSSTHLAHPRLAFVHGLSPLHSLPQPTLSCREKRGIECCLGSSQPQGQLLPTCMLPWAPGVGPPLDTAQHNDTKETDHSNQIGDTVNQMVRAFHFQALVHELDGGI